MPTENRSSNTVQMVNVPRPGREHWDKLCALPRYMFLLRPSGKGVQKFEDPTGNWIDVHEAQKVMDAAMDEIAELRHLLNQPPADSFSAGDMADQGAKAFAARDGEVEQLKQEVLVARAQGRAEAVDMILDLEAETGLDEFIGSHAIADTGDYGSHWKEAELREHFSVDEPAASELERCRYNGYEIIQLREERDALLAQAARWNELLERMKAMFLRDAPCDLYDAVCSVLADSKAPK